MLVPDMLVDMIYLLMSWDMYRQKCQQKQNNKKCECVKAHKQKSQTANYFSSTKMSVANLYRSSYESI